MTTKKQVNSRLLSVMFADVQGYTRKAAGQTREDNLRFVEEIRTFVAEYLTKWQGSLVKTMGDGFLATFDSPSNAIQCGLEMQRKLESRNAGVINPDNFIRFRIGINSGEVNLDSNGDIFGDVVNIAARIESFAEPNEVFISEATYLAMNQNEVGAIDLGLQQFKNAAREVRVYKICKSPGLKGRQIPQSATPKPSPTAKFTETVLFKVICGFLIFLLGFGMAFRLLKRRARGPAPQTAPTPDPSGREEPSISGAEHQPPPPDSFAPQPPPLSGPHPPPDAPPHPIPHSPQPPDNQLPFPADFPPTFPSIVPPYDYFCWVHSLPVPLKEKIFRIEKLAGEGKLKEADELVTKIFSQDSPKRKKEIPIAAIVRSAEIKLGAGNTNGARLALLLALKKNKDHGNPVPNLREKLNKEFGHLLQKKSSH
jgi:class 3 adenylate cyclase